MMRFDTDIETKDRKRLVLSDFGGVDTANPIFSVSNKRATAMRNFIKVDGNNHKRNGWKQVARFKDENGVDLPINGVFDIVIAKETRRIVYAGTRFFMYNDETEAYIDLIDLMETQGQSCENKIDTTRLLSRKIQVFVYGDVAYFIGCGDLITLAMYDGTLELRRVYNDENTTIPLTTTNIAPNETDKNFNDTVTAYGELAIVSRVNLLSRYRTNKLIGSANANITEYAVKTEKTFYSDTALTTSVGTLSDNHFITAYDTTYATFVGDGTDGTDSTDYYVASSDCVTGYCGVRTYNLDDTDLDTDKLTISAIDYDSDTGATTTHDIYVSSVTTSLRNATNGDDLAGKTLNFDTTLTSYSTIRKSIFSDTADVLKANDVYIYWQTSDGLTWNSVNLYADINGAVTQIASATRSNLFSNYTVTWAETSIAVGAELSAVVTYCNYADSDKWNITALLPLAERDLIEDISGGTTTWGTINFSTGLISFTKSAVSIAGEANITVNLAKTDETATNNILNCKFGTLFGVSGNANILFLSGNPDKANYDYWTFGDDFTYFPSTFYQAFGTENNIVMGYQRLGDDTLAILKSPSSQEPVLYIRNTATTATINEDLTISETTFSVTGKYINQGVISQSSIAMLNSDTLFLSNNGVFGLEVSNDTVSVDIRVAKERSRFINTLLSKHDDLSNAVCTTYDNRYYVALEDNIYVADGRYVFTIKGDMPDTYNYEWWVWDNCPVRVWCELDGCLCFGTDDGRLCVFDDYYTDREFEQFDAFTFDAENERIYPDNSVTLATDDKVYFNGDIYRIFYDSEDITVTDGKLYLSEEDILRANSGQALCADTVGESGLATDTVYYIDEVDVGNLYITLIDANGNAVSPTANGFRLLTNFDGEVVKVTVATDNEELTYFTVKNADNDEVYQVATYNETSITAGLFKYIAVNVVAEWFTPVFDMGANDYIKQLLALTVATEQVTNGNMTFGYETKSVVGLVNINAQGLDVFSFSNLNFNKFTFDTGFSTSFTRKVKAGFNFIIFRFVSDNEYDCCVNSFTIYYKINRRNKGVM